MSDRPVNVLLVEDDENDILFMKEAFAQVGAQVCLDVVKDGEAAIAKLTGLAAELDARKPPGFTHLILDLKLPRKSGLEVLAWIRTRPVLACLSIAVLTSSHERSDLEAVRALGVERYHVKPLSFRELNVLVRRLCQDWGIAPDGPGGR